MTDQLIPESLLHSNSRKVGIELKQQSDIYSCRTAVFFVNSQQVSNKLN